MIRIRFRDSVYAVKEINGYPYIKEIIFRTEHDKHTITFKSSLMVEVLLNQACECGFINLDVEEIEEYTIN